MIEKLNTLLNEMHPGYRGSFWACSDPKASSIPILFASSKNGIDAERDKLKKGLKAVSIPSSATTHEGLVQVDVYGTIRLISSGFPTSIIDTISKWSKENEATYPSLSRLQHMVVADQQEEPDTPPSSYSSHSGVAAEFNKLIALAPLETYNLWAIGKLQNGQSYITSSKSDTPIKVLQKKVACIRQHYINEKSIIMGVLTKMEQGSYVFFTEDSLEIAHKVFQRLFSQYISLFPHISSFSPIRMLKTENGEVTESLRFSWQAQPTESPKEEFIFGLHHLASKEQELHFFFDKKSLLVALSKNELKELVTKNNITKGIRGTIRRSSKGFFVFQTTKDISSLLNELIQYVSEHLSSSPVLEELFHTRHIVRNKEGETIARYKEDKSWNKLIQPQQ